MTPRAMPQKVGPASESAPKPRRRRLWIVSLIVAALVIAGVVVAALLVTTNKGPEPESAESKIRTSVTTFTDALAGGDLAVLRTSTCGDLAGYYTNIPDAEFASVHDSAVAQGNIPMIESIDAVQVTDATAIVQVTASTKSAPTVTSARTFDLEQQGDVWKVCR
ncbi:hypothetical protein GCM10007304_39110 [Rhodococcoides trifolii]|uniref:DUF4878 domain-containing protein n=1 Tax=Rhodococcoides trifolii TaxID=908250 RepID=A0A917G3U2_9NOCA|nr:hypothetical protein [Rhodococcus trifolii]GGG21467.1 hypothetical protein GCM10007304_39110 [Rhodococcus trifolii]